MPSSSSVATTPLPHHLRGVAKSSVSQRSSAARCMRALSLQSMLNMDLTWALIFFGVTTGAYTIYAAHVAAWTDFMQVALLLTAGILIPVLGLARVGAWVP